MLLEVYSSEKPARRGRGLLCAIALLAIAGGLAARMTWRRAGGGLGARVCPEGWEASIQPPRYARADDLEPTPMGTAVRWLARSNAGAPVLLTLHRASGDARISSVDLCALVLRYEAGERSLGVSLMSVAGGLGITAQTLGPMDAVEFREADGSFVVRAAMLDDRTGFALSLATPRGAIDEATYALFESVCASVAMEGP